MGAPPVAVVLSYHRIAELTPDTHGLCVNAAALREHMEEVSRRHRPISLGELARAAAAGDMPAGAVSVTFDDGYLDALGSASVVLTTCGIPATFFVTTEGLDTKREFLWDTLERVFLGGQRIPRILDVRLGQEVVACSVASEDERKATHAVLHRKLVRMGHAERSEVVERLAAWSGLDLTPRETHRPMVGEELRRLVERSGHGIGAHTIHHVWLPSETHEARRREIIGSKAALERLLGRPVDTFCYPYGALDEETVETVRSASFRAAVTTRRDVVRPGCDPLRLPRWEVEACDGTQFAARLRRFFEAGASEG